MLQRSNAPINVQGFLVAVEMQADSHTSVEQVALRIAEGLAFLEGIGHVDVDALGQIDVLDEDGQKEPK